MAYNITLRFPGGMFDLSVTAKQAVEDKDKDTTLRTVCVGDGQVKDVATGEVNTHDPIPPKQHVICPTCELTHSSFTNKEWAKGRDNGDGTYDLVPNEVIESTKAGEEYTKTPTLTLHPIADIEQLTLASGKFYYLIPGKDVALKYPAVVGAVLANQARGRAFVTMYAPSSVAALWRVIVIDNVLALQELAMPERVRLRPAIPFPDAQQAHIDMLLTCGDFTFGPLVPDTYEDNQRKVIAAALAESTPTSAGATPAVAARPSADPFAALESKIAAKLASGETVPLQALPSEVPGNVSTALLDEKPAPKKRAPRKKAS